MCSKTAICASTGDFWAETARLRSALDRAEAVVVGAGSGLSASAGLTYDGPRFHTHFADFIEKYHFQDMYSAGFYPYPTLEEFWAYWSRHIWFNRYVPIPGRAYQDLLELVGGKDYFVLTTNVDHCFQRAGFDKARLFYTQGDYGLWQCSRPCCQKTYDNRAAVERMLSEQRDLRVPEELVPRCPECGAPMSMNLRCDGTFVQDEGWYAAQARCRDFLARQEGRRVLFLELGVGGNTPVIIKYPFWRMTQSAPDAVYACVNLGQAYAPQAIAERSICVDGDIAAALSAVLGRRP